MDVWALMVCPRARACVSVQVLSVSVEEDVKRWSEKGGRRKSELKCTEGSLVLSSCGL